MTQTNKTKHLIGIGELLWDCLPTGNVLGGAPGNFAIHGSSLGAQGTIVSCLGDDDLGREATSIVAQRGLSTDYLSTHDSLPTGTVDVTLVDGEPQYDIKQPVAWDHITVTPELTTLVKQADAICFGSLAQRDDVSRQSIQGLLAGAPDSSLRIFDINLRQDFYSQALIQESLQLGNALKINEEELPVVAKFENLTGDKETQIKTLAQRYDLKLIAYTKGAEGAYLLGGDEFIFSPSLPTTVVDPIGAGDSFTATLAMGYLVSEEKGLSLNDMGKWANAVASFVCSHAGATPALPDSLINFQA